MEWIRTKEKTPDKGQQILIYYGNNTNNGIKVMAICYVERFFNMMNPSHWMPLPEPPKEK
jgi:hypothetical protein